MRLLPENSNNEASRTATNSLFEAGFGESPFSPEGVSEPQNAGEAAACYSQMEQASQPTHKVIHHPHTPGIIIYAGAGRPCKKCGCFFQNSYDYYKHNQICEDKNWRQSNFGNNRKFRPVEEDPELAQALARQGKITIGNCTYRLSQNKKWIIREAKQNNY